MTGQRPARPGSLERAFLEVLWTHDEPIPARQVQTEAGRDLAYATVRTVLERLVRKGLVEHSRDGRTLLYSAAGTRESFVSELMLEALRLTSDRDAALAHFARSVSADEAVTLTEALRAAARRKR